VVFCVATVLALLPFGSAVTGLLDPKGALTGPRWTMECDKSMNPGVAPPCDTKHSEERLASG